MISLFSRDNGGIWWQHEVDSWIWDQVGLEFSNINIQSSIESQWGGQWWDNLGNQSVQVGVSGSFNIQVSSADIINGFIVQHNADISVFQKRMSGQDGVIWFNNGSWDLGRWIDGES